MFKRPDFIVILLILVFGVAMTWYVYETEPAQVRSGVIIEKTYKPAVTTTKTRPSFSLEGFTSYASTQPVKYVFVVRDRDTLELGTVTVSESVYNKFQEGYFYD